ncbi:MAG: hypothetical protein ACRDQI_00415 [Pseudonocardiaceae bacterium]
MSLCGGLVIALLNDRYRGRLRLGDSSPRGGMRRELNVTDVSSGLDVGDVEFTTH